MLDPSGNELDATTENSIQMRAIVMADNLNKAVWKLAHASVGKRTKSQMIDDMNEATELIMQVRKELIGR